MGINVGVGVNAGSGVAVAVGIGVGVAVAVGIRVGVAVEVGVGVDMGGAVGVGVGSGVGAGAGVCARCRACAGGDGVAVTLHIRVLCSVGLLDEQAVTKTAARSSPNIIMAPNRNWLAMRSTLFIGNLRTSKGLCRPTRHSGESRNPGMPC